MCVVSMIGDHYQNKFDPWKDMLPEPKQPFIPSTIPNNTKLEFVDRAAFEQLKRDVIEMKELLKRALEYDKKQRQPHCENSEKLDLLRKVAAAVGVSLEDILPSER